MSDEKSFDLGDRVSVVPEAGTLPHPQGGFNPWATAESSETPFGEEAVPSCPQTGPGLPVGYDPSSVREQKKEAQVPIAPATATSVPARGKRPLPADIKVSRKETELLSRFRETFGLQRIKVQEGIIERRDPNNPDVNTSLKFGLRGLSYEDYQWVLEKAASFSPSERLVSFAWKIAVCSMGVASFEGTPIWEVLGFEPESTDSVRDPMYPAMGLRFRSADAFCDELQGAMFDLVESIYSLYEEKIDNKYYPKTSKVGDEEEASGPLAQSGSKS